MIVIVERNAFVSFNSQNCKIVSSHSIAEHRLNSKPTSCMSQSDISCGVIRVKVVCIYINILLYLNETYENMLHVQQWVF